MQKLNKFFKREYLIKYVTYLYILSIILDLHIFYNSISTLIRVGFISILFIIIFIKYSSLEEKKLLIAYFLTLFIYIILHLWNTNAFSISFLTKYDNLSEILYFVKMIMNVFIIYIVYKLEIDKNNFYKIINISAFIISFSIIICNLFKIGYTSYTFNTPSFNLIDWFMIDKINFATASTKGYFHLTNQISAILILYLPILLSYLKEKFSIWKLINIIFLIISLFMLGTRVSSYLPFIILVFAFIIYLITSITRHNFSKKYFFSLILFFIVSLILYNHCPLISRNLYYSDLFKEKENTQNSEEFKQLNSKNITDLSLKELKTYLGYFNIDEDFYNTYYPLEIDPEFYKDYVSLKTTKINDTRFLELKIIERVQSLNNRTWDNYLGIGYTRVINIFNIESDYVMQYYAIGIVGVILILGVNIILLLFLGFKMLFNLKRYFTYENVLLLFSIFIFLFSSYFTGNILNAISCIIPISFVLGFTLSKMKNKEQKDYEYYLGFKVTTKSAEEILDNIFKIKKQNIIYNINPLIIMNFLHNKKVKKEINQESYNIPDGNGIVLASSLTSNNIKKSIPGVTFLEEIVKRSEDKKYKIYLYGAKEESVKMTKEYLENKYAHIKIVGYQNGYSKDKNKDILEIVKLKPDILFVALGSPYQEEFIINNKEKLKDIKIIMPVGGSFDALSGNVKRAPRIVQKLKLEWLYRMIKEPKRFKDLFKLIKFSFMVLFANFWYNDK